MKNKGIIISIVILIIVILGIIFTVTKTSENGGNETKVSEQTMVKEDYPNEAIFELEKKVKADPENDKLLLNLALEYHKIPSYDKEEDIYKKLMDLKPGENLYRFNLADNYIQQKRYKDAVDILLEALEINSKFLNAFGPILDVYEFDDKSVVPIDDVISQLLALEERKGIDLNNLEYQNVLIYLARAYRLNENNEKAIEYYQKKIDNNVGSKDANQAEIDKLKQNL